MDMNKLRFFAALWTGKAIQLLLRLLGRGATYFAGSAAIRLCPDFLARVGRPETVVGVTGTNGKTTVCNMLADLLENMGRRVLSNRQGSNIDAGIATALLDGASLSGRCRYKTAVLEIDERSARRVYPYLQPELIVCTNLFRDSMRRNAHPEYIADVLTEHIPAGSKLLLNADDLISSAIAPENARVYFGMARLEGEEDAPDNIVRDVAVCPVCGRTLEYDFRRYHHIGRARCACGFASPEADYLAQSADFAARRLRVLERGEARDYPLVSETVFNIYNELAAVAALRELGCPAEEISAALEKTKVVASRYLEESAGGKTVTMLMAKGLNAVACSRGFDLVSREPGRKLVALMLDDIFDEKESSENIAWLYDADHERLSAPDVVQIVACGPRAADAKLRLLVAGVPEERIDCVRSESEVAAALKYGEGERIFLLFDVYRHDMADRVRGEVIKRLSEAEK